MSQSFPAEEPRDSIKRALLIALLISTPFLLITLFSRNETEPLILLIAALPLTISTLIVYAVYASSRMTYNLSENEFSISFPLNPLKIKYSKIKGVGKVETTLRFRIFGGSLPGSYWGLFSTSSVGNTQAYTTKYKGEFVLIELVDGTRILTSPQKPDELLEALRNRTSFTAPSNINAPEPKLDRSLAYLQVAAVGIAWLALVAYVASIYPILPEVIPVHFGLNGVPNRYGSKVELLILLAVSALFPTLNTIFTLKVGKYSKRLNLFLSFIFLLAVGLFAFVVYQIIQSI